VALTAVTAILGVLAIAFGVNIDFVNRSVAVGAPSTQWWVHLSTAIVFGLGFATLLTLIVTPAALLVIARIGEWRPGWLKVARRKWPFGSRAATHPAE
jgi:multidrug efflux pump